MTTTYEFSPAQRLLCDAAYSSESTRDQCGSGLKSDVVIDTTHRLRVLNQNLWGLPVVTDKLERRVAHFVTELHKWDVVIIQVNAQHVLGDLSSLLTFVTNFFAGAVACPRERYLANWGCRSGAAVQPSLGAWCWSVCEWACVWWDRPHGSLSLSNHRDALSPIHHQWEMVQRPPRRLLRRQRCGITSFKDSSWCSRRLRQSPTRQIHQG